MPRNANRKDKSPRKPAPPIVRKLGKLEPKHDPRTLKLARYLLSPLPAPPAEVSWVTKVPGWGMMLNDQIGDCTCAAAGHMVQQWSFFANPPGTIPTDQQILAAYERVSGYNPADPSTDNGAVMLDVLKYWRNVGVGGHRIVAFVQVDHTNDVEVRQAIQIFGNIYVGLALPVSAQEQGAWTVGKGGPAAGGDNAPGSWGGHAVPVMAASPHSLTCITWGERLKMSHNFFTDYCDEAYAAVSQDWIAARGGKSPSGLNLRQLLADLQQI